MRHRNVSVLLYILMQFHLHRNISVFASRDTTYNVLPAPQSIETRACSVVLNRIKLEPTEIEKLSEQCDIEASDQQEESGYDSSPQHFNLTQTTGAILSNSTTPVTMTKRKSTLHDKVVNSSGNLAKNPSKRRKVVSNASDKVIDSKSATNPLIKCSRNVNCKEYFESIDAMKYHVLTYHAAGVKKSFSCHLCGRSFPRNPLLRFHVKSKHTGQVPRIPCLIQTCSMTFIQKRSMKQHVNAVHTKKIAYKCPKCPMKFYNIDNLKYHLGAKHDKGNSSFRCHVCDVRICSKSSLKVHINSVHMGIKPFKCPFPMCSQACAHKRDLKIHINVRHTKEIVYGCTQCPKKFYARKNLTNHFNNMHRK